MKGILRDLRKASSAVEAEIRGNASHGKYGAGLSAEGYAGGYRDALRDVNAALGGWGPSNSRFWPPPNVAPRRSTGGSRG